MTIDLFKNCLQCKSKLTLITCNEKISYRCDKCYTIISPSPTAFENKNNIIRLAPLGNYYPANNFPTKHDKDQLTQNLLKNKSDCPEVAFALADAMFKKEIKLFTDTPLVVVPVPNFIESSNTSGVSIALKLKDMIQEKNSATIYADAIKRLVQDKVHLIHSPWKRESFWDENQVYQLTKPKEIFGKQILLIDDITTTGKTIERCIKELLKGTPSKIFVYTAAKTYHN